MSSDEGFRASQIICILKKLLLLYPIILFLVLAACKDQEGSHSERAYTIEGSFDVDSTIVLDHLVLYTDRHTGLLFDSLDLNPHHSFVHSGSTRSLDELYLCSDGGELCRFYATGNVTVSMRLNMAGDSVKAIFDSSKGDSINPWLQQQTAFFRTLLGPAKKDAMDSLCHQHTHDIRCGLLLRDQIEVLKDSIFVRRCLGGLADDAKPDWLMKSIDRTLEESSRKPRPSRRLAPCVMQTDSTNFDFSASRSDYLLIFIWGDYSQSSVDSLKTVANLANDEYDMKRLQLVTICLSAPDSTWWRQQTQGIKGLHAWLPAGLSDERMRKWDILNVPTVIVCDMYNNQQIRNEWGQRLRATLGRVPNRSSFTHTPKPIANRGR